MDEVEKEINQVEEFLLKNEFFKEYTDINIIKYTFVKNINITRSITIKLEVYHVPVTSRNINDPSVLFVVGINNTEIFGQELLNLQLGHITGEYLLNNLEKINSILVKAWIDGYGYTINPNIILKNKFDYMLYKLKHFISKH